MLDAALAYAGLGWHVFPVHGILDGRCTCGRTCKRAGKHPWTAHGLNDATDDKDKIKAWWREHPMANVGIATGASGLVVVDADVSNGKRGDETWREITIQHGPPTR